jgi:hypothetical protein
MFRPRNRARVLRVSKRRLLSSVETLFIEQGRAADRVELVDVSEHLADMDGWLQGHLDDVSSRAVRGPLSDLMPNLAYCRKRLDKARAAAATGKR